MLACSTPTRVVRAPEPGESTFTVATYNVNFGLAGDPQGVEVIRELDVDIIVLQETNRRWERAIYRAVHKKYPQDHFHHVGAAGGSAILSKFPLIDVRILRPEVEGSWFPVMIAVVDTNAGRLQIANVHLRPQLGDNGGVVSGYFETPKIRRAEMRAIMNALDPELPTLIAGDFNESGGDAIAVLEDRGYEDGMQAFIPDADTWRWSTSLLTVESQLDHVVYDRRIDPLNVVVVEAGRSDHLPVVARLTLRPRKEPSVK